MSHLRQHLSAPGLLQTIRQRFSTIPDSRMGTPHISLSDGLMAGLAVFGLKCSSLLQFDQQRCDPVVEHNLRQLYGIAQVPCDTQLRKILDPVDPRLLRPAFKAVFAQAQRSKVLEDYVFFDGHYLLALDGTGFFASSSVSCPHCCVKKAGTDKERYYHQLLGGVLVHPAHKEVIPLAPEPIIRADGQEKNDCERNAAKRFLADTRREHPDRPLIVVLIRWPPTDPISRRSNRWICALFLASNPAATMLFLKRRKPLSIPLRGSISNAPMPTTTASRIVFVGSKNSRSTIATPICASTSWTTGKGVPRKISTSLGSRIYW